MCLIVLDWNYETKRLVLASNRDEYYNRPSQHAHYWKNDRGGRNVVYGGKDSQLGGTWLACSSSSPNGNNNRLAAVTNFFTKSSRLGLNQPRYPLSRGDLVHNFVASSISSVSSSVSINNKGDDDNKIGSTRSTSISAKEYCREIERNHQQYGGFCAFFMDGTTLYYCTNRKQSSTTTDHEEYEFEYFELKTGTYGLSNHLLDTPWPKILKAKEGLKQAIELYLEDGNSRDCDDNNIKDQTQLQKMLANHLIDHVMENTGRVNDRMLLPTTLNPEEEHMRSSIFVKGGDIFGTRTTTIVVSDKQRNNQGHGFHVTEKNHITPYVTTPHISYQHVVSHH